MIYFTPPSTPKIRAQIAAGRIGLINTPRQGSRSQHVAGATWMADNGCFNQKTFATGRWFDWLQSLTDLAATCVLATAPDVPYDADATAHRAAPWLPRIRELGFPAGYVAQDGITTPPWDDLDALFIGGSTAFKLGPQPRRLAAQARRRGKWVHVGRVNSLRRFRLAHDILKADSCDGTRLVFGPDINLLALLRWVDHIDHQPALALDYQP